MSDQYARKIAFNFLKTYPRDRLHRNSNLLLDEKAEEEFCKQNPSPEEIEELLKTLDEVLTGMATRAKFYPLTDPDISIKHQIKDIFQF